MTIKDCTATSSPRACTALEATAGTPLVPLTSPTTGAVMTRIAVRVQAARVSHDSSTLEAEALADALAGILAVAPDSTVTLTVGSTLDGNGLVMITAESPTAAEVAAELEQLFDPYFTTTLEPADDANLTTWSLDSASSEPVGFGDDRPGAVPWAPSAKTGERRQKLLREWLFLSLQNPGLRLQWSVTCDRPARGPRPFHVTASISHAHSQLPLRARELSQRLLDLVVAQPSGGELRSIATDRAGATWLMHLPVSDGEPLPGIPVAFARPIPMRPTSVSESGIRLGSAVLPSGRLTEVRMASDETQRHIHVYGQTGSGKTSTLAAIFQGIVRAGDGVLVVDAHGELTDRLIAELPDEAAQRTWVIRAGDVHNPVPLNPFAIDDEVQLDIAIQDIILIFYKLFDRSASGIVGPRFEGMLTNALRGLRAIRGTRAGLLDVPRVYRDERIERAIAEAVTDPRQIDFWRHEMRGMSASSRSEVLGWFTSKFDRFANTAAMRGILGTGADAFNPSDAMDSSRVILLDLSKARLGEVSSNLLGFLYLTRFWTGIMNRKNTRRFGFIIDEAQSFAAGSLPALLSEGRKWGASVTVAHQYLSQLDPELSAALAGNAATTIAFRAGGHDASQVAARLGGGVTPDMVAAQPDLHALLCRSSGRVLSQPHTLLIDHNDVVVAREGAGLAEFRRRLMRITHRDLVDPHRELVAFEPPAHGAPARPRPSSARALPMAQTRQSGSRSHTVLDEWLESRQVGSAPGDDDRSSLSEEAS